MFNRRNAIVGYLVMKAIRSQMRKNLRKSRKRAGDVDWREYAQYLDAREHTRSAAAVAVLVGVVLGAAAWLATAGRRR